MAPQNDGPSGRAKRSYLICSSPRAGSNLLTKALRKTGKGGVPFEYFNPISIKAYATRIGERQLRFDQYVEFLLTNRIDSHGTFGLKAHFHQASALLVETEDLSSFLSRFDRIIFLRRRNKVSQAISDFRARSSGTWFADDLEQVEQARRASQSYDSVAISESLAFILADERGWSDILKFGGHAHLSIFFEDLGMSFRSTLETVINYLNLDVTLADRLDPPTFKLSDEISAEWEREFERTMFGR